VVAMIAICTMTLMLFNEGQSNVLGKKELKQHQVLPKLGCKRDTFYQVEKKCLRIHQFLIFFKSQNCNFY
jgi:hypothetical protein